MHLAADAVVGPRTLSAIVNRDHVPVRAVPVRAVITTSYRVRPGDSLTAIARARGITLVLDVSKMQGVVMVVNNAVDITDAFIADYNQRNPASTAAAAPASR
jgi:hypothetical protein